MAAVSIMTMTLFLASVFFLIAAGSQKLLQFFESRPQLNAYYATDITPQDTDIQAIKQKMIGTGLVDTFKFISKSDALKLYKEMNKTDPLLLEAVTAEMLPASLEITAKNPSDLKRFSELLSAEKGIKEVRFGEDVVATLSKWVGSIRMIGMALVGSHILITFSIILMVISIKVATRREEITILQLVGATGSYISSPFIWEGIFYGIFGAIISWGITYLVLISSNDFLNSFLAGTPLLPVPVTFMLWLLLGEIVLGTVVGGMGALAATRRFMKS
jgi:cell division transport system permease protein